MADAEAEELRRDLLQLPLQELKVLASSEGLRCPAHSSAHAIVDALLSMAWQDAAGAAPVTQAPSRLAHAKDQPQNQSSARSRWHKPPQPGQLLPHHAGGQPQHHTVGPASGSSKQRHGAAASTAPHLGQQAAHPELHYAQQQQQQHATERDTSFTFASHHTTSKPHSSSNAWGLGDSGRRTTGDDNACHTQHDDQRSLQPAAHAAAGSAHPQPPRSIRTRVAGPPPLAAAVAPPQPAPAAAGSPLTPRQQRQAQHQLMLETKMQQLEESLQQLHMSPRGLRSPRAAQQQQQQQEVLPGHSGVVRVASGPAAGDSSVSRGRASTPQRMQRHSPLAAAHRGARRPPSASGGGSSAATAPAGRARTPMPQRHTNRAATPPTLQHDASRRGHGAPPGGISSTGGGGSASAAVRQRSATPPPQRCGSAASTPGHAVTTPASSGSIGVRAAGSTTSTPLVGVMPCQKALLRRRQAEAATAAAGTAAPTAAAAGECAGDAGAAVRSSRTPQRARPTSAGGGSSNGTGRISGQHPATAAPAARALPAAIAKRPGAQAAAGTSRPAGGSPHTPRDTAARSAVSPAAARARSPSPLRGAGSMLPQAGGGSSHVLLHTPMRVPVSNSSRTAVGSAAVMMSRQGHQAGIGGCTTPLRAGSGAANAAGASGFADGVTSTPVRAGGVPAAGMTAGPQATPMRQTVRAFGGGDAPLQQPAGAAGPLATPKLQSSARRVVATRSRTAAAAAAAGGVAALPLAGVPQAAAVGGGPGAAPHAVGMQTPLQRKARRTVSGSSGGGDAADKHLQALVERCLLQHTPSSHQQGATAGKLDGSDPTRRWLQQALVAPLRRAGSAAGPRGAGHSAASGGLCGAAGFCSAALLLHGPAGAGKTHLVTELAAEMGASLLHVPAGSELFRAHPEDGHRLLRALFAVARRTAPCVVCVDDVDRSFAGSQAAALSAEPGAAEARRRMLVELEVQLQQLADMQEQLEAQQQQRRHGASGSSGGGCGTPAAPRPAWGFSGGARAAASARGVPDDVCRDEQQQQQQQPAYARLGGPIVVVFVARRPDGLGGALQQLLRGRLLRLDLPAAEAREELLLGWLMEAEAAVGVGDLEALARSTHGFSTGDLMQLCQQAAASAGRRRRPVCMADLEAALQAVGPAVQARQQQ